MAHTRRLPPLHSLRILEALYLTGSVTRAANHLNVTHSAVSQQIRQIEQWSGRTMVRRVGRQSRLTEEGESLARVAREAFDAIRHEVDRLPLRSRRPVSIAALPIVAAEWLMSMLPDLLEKDADVSVHLSYALSDRPLQPEPDIAILFGLRDTLGPDDLPLLAGDAAPVCAPALLDRYEGDPARALMRGPYLHDEDLRMWPDWMEAAELRPNADAPQPQIYLEGSSLMKSAALAGHGIALCRLALMRDDLAHGRLVQLSGVTTDGDWIYFARSNAARRTDTSVASVLSWLEARAAEEVML